MGLLSTPLPQSPAHMKWIRRLLLLPVLLLALYIASWIVFVLIFGIESYYAPNPAIDTVFAPGYSEEKFAMIRSGDSHEDVLALLGEPLERSGWLGVRDS